MVALGRGVQAVQRFRGGAGGGGGSATAMAGADDGGRATGAVVLATGFASLNEALIPRMRPESDR